MILRKFLAILWKEWKGLQPFFFLLIVLFVFGLLLVQFTEFMDEQPIWDSLLSIAGNTTIITFALCVIVSLGLLTREIDEGSLTFLDGLPLSRFSIYLAKWFLAFLMIAIISLIWTAESLIYEFLSKESNSPKTPWNHVATFTFLNTFLCAFFLAILFPISFLRVWSLLLIGCLFWMLMILRAYGIPFVTWIDPFALMQPPEEVDDTWVIPWRHLAVLTSIGVFGWALGAWLFSRKEGFRNRWSNSSLSWIPKLLTMIGFLIIPVIWIGLIIFAVYQEDAKGNFGPEPIKGTDIRPAAEGGNAIRIRETGKFVFVYRKKLQSRLNPLMEESDDIFQTVAEFLEAEESATSGKTTIDLSNPVGSHNAGQAYWKKIRMILPGRKAPPGEAAAILAHEVTHVLMERITRGRLEESFQATKWFHEGLASHVEFALFREPDARLDYEHWLALASAWGEVHFSELVVDPVLSKKRDPHLVYPAGMLWIEAAIDVYGNECPANLLRAIGRPDGPRKLVGMERWRDACLAAGYDLERIRSRYRIKLKELRETYKNTIEKYPEIKEGSAAKKDGQIVITPELPDGWRDKIPEKASLVCRVRQDDHSSPGQWRYSKLDNDQSTFSVSALHFLKPKISFQIGWKTNNWSKQPVYGEWIQATVE